MKKILLCFIMFLTLITFCGCSTEVANPVQEGADVRFTRIYTQHDNHYGTIISVIQDKQTGKTYTLWEDSHGIFVTTE